MNISNNKVVSLHYVLREGNEAGQLIEETFDGPPFTYLHSTMFESFEEQLNNLTIGDKFSFSLTPEEAYGPFLDDNVVEVPLENFADDDGNVDMEFIQVGEPINMTDAEGHVYNGVITKVMEESLVVDFNHPLAGIPLHFAGEVIAIRDASPEEIDHGHVHEDGDHDHH